MSEAARNPAEAIPLPGVHPDHPLAGVHVEPGLITAFDVKAGVKLEITLSNLIEAKDSAGVMAFAQILYLRDILTASAATEQHMRQAVNAASGARGDVNQQIDTAMDKVAAMMKRMGENQGGFDAEGLVAAMRGPMAEAPAGGGTPA